MHVFFLFLFCVFDIFWCRVEVVANVIYVYDVLCGKFEEMEDSAQRSRVLVVVYVSYQTMCAVLFCVQVLPFL